MTNATQYRIRDSKMYLSAVGAAYAWTRKAKQAATFPNRATAEAAARDVESRIFSRCGYAVPLKIVPATGGAEIARK